MTLLYYSLANKNMTMEQKNDRQTTDSDVIVRGFNVSTRRHLV